MKVISFSIWGDNPTYTIGAVKNADLAKQLYPDWKCWFYVGTSCPKEIVKQLKARDNCLVIPMEDEGDWTGMFWRFLPASDPSVEVMLSRDTDSRLNQREKEAVEEWLSSDKSFHIMRDHPYHATAILGGMWGCKYPALKDMDKLMSNYSKGDFWQVDQNFLRDVVYHKVKDDCMVHDEFFEKKPFPSARSDKNFVGMGFDENDEPLHHEHMELLK